MAADAEIEAIFEPAAADNSGLAFHPEHEPFDLPEGVKKIELFETEPGKVWIEGIGYMFRGKPWDSGEEKTTKYRKPKGKRGRRNGRELEPA